MEKYKILIIEDDPIIQTELQVLLNGNGYEASAVTDFTSVMQAVKNTHPYLILLDIKLPQESGYSICSQIRSFSNVPIIFVTSCNTDMDELNSILLGGDAFITKPYNTAILLAKISSLMKRAYPIEQIERLNWQGAILHLESSTIEYDGMRVYHSNSSKEAYLFSTTIKGVTDRMSVGNVQRIIKKYAALVSEAGISIPDSVHCHMFRRTRATNLYQDGIAIELVSTVLGHARTDTTKNYYAKQSVEQLRGAMESVPTPIPDEAAMWEGSEDEMARICGLR